MEFNCSKDKIEVFSSFNLDSICMVLSEIMSAYEDEEYIYKHSIYERGFSDNYFLACIVLKDNVYNTYYKKTNYESQNFILLNHDKKLFPISMKKIYNWDLINIIHQCFNKDEIKFYYVDNSLAFYNHNIESPIVENFGELRQFPYLKDFINYIIKYRIQNDIKDVSLNLLRLLMKEFLEIRKEEICEYKDKKRKEVKSLKLIR